MPRPLTPTAQAFREALRGPAQAARQPIAARLPRLAQLSTGLTADDAVALGLWPTVADRSGALELASGDAQPAFGLLSLSRTPDGAHVALGWAHAAQGVRLWIDGQELPLPRSPEGESRVLGAGGWCGSRFYGLQWVLEAAMGPEVPQRPDTAARLGLWLWDTARAQALPILPGVAEHWPSPWVRAVDAAGIQVIADRSRPAAAPVRTVPFIPGTGPRP